MGPKVAPKRGQDSQNYLGQGRRRGQDIHFEVFWVTLYQKLQFLEMYEKQQEKHGLKGRRASGRPSWRHLVPKVAPKRGQDGQNGLGQGLLRSLVRLYCRSCNFLKCMKNLRKSMVFEGSERVRAPKLEPLGPQSRAREGSGQPK